MGPNAAMAPGGWQMAQDWLTVSPPGPWAYVDVISLIPQCVIGRDRLNS